jgi:hypothetical protein
MKGGRITSMSAILKPDKLHVCEHFGTA